MAVGPTERRGTAGSGRQGHGRRSRGEGRMEGGDGCDGRRPRVARATRHTRRQRGLGPRDPVNRASVGDSDLVTPFRRLLPGHRWSRIPATVRGVPRVPRPWLDNARRHQRHGAVLCALEGCTLDTHGRYTSATSPSHRGPWTRRRDGTPLAPNHDRHARDTCASAARIMRLRTVTRQPYRRQPGSSRRNGATR